MSTTLFFILAFAITWITLRMISKRLFGFDFKLFEDEEKKPGGHGHDLERR